MANTKTENQPAADVQPEDVALEKLEKYVRRDIRGDIRERLGRMDNLLEEASPAELFWFRRFVLDWDVNSSLSVAVDYAIQLAEAPRTPEPAEAKPISKGA